MPNTFVLIPGSEQHELAAIPGDDEHLRTVYRALLSDGATQKVHIAVSTVPIDAAFDEDYVLGLRQAATTGANA